MSKRRGRRKATPPPLLIMGAVHIKKQTGRACSGALAYSVQDEEYSCIACGWREDGAEVLKRIRTLKRKRTEIILK